MNLEEELARILPPDIPHRDRLIQLSARHLAFIAAANEHMNLTRISNPREAVIKHVYDSVAPWEAFRHARKILDAGTGAGFPGLPLSVVLPEAKFILAESIQKKARFVESVVDDLELSNVHVIPERAEILVESHHPEIITARAVAPIYKLVELFAKALKTGSRLLLYKGPDVEAELNGLGSRRVSASIVCRYALPENLGTRTLVSISAQDRPARKDS